MPDTRILDMEEQMHLLWSSHRSMHRETGGSHPTDPGAAVADTKRDTVQIPRHAAGPIPRSNEVSDFTAGMICVICAGLIFALGMILGATIW